MRICIFLLWCCPTVAAWADATSYKNYKLLQGQEGAGSAFVIKQSSSYFAVFTIHQFDGRKPKIEDSTGNPVPLMPAPTMRSDDLEAWELTDQSGSQPYLAHSEDFKLKDGDKLAILTHEGTFVTGELVGLGIRTYDSEDGCELLGLRLSTPVDAAGLSGSPICKVSDGKVIGVLTGADKPFGAQEILFKTLRIRTSGAPRKKSQVEEKSNNTTEKTLTLTTLQGITYTGVTVSNSDGEKLSIVHDGGVTTIAAKSLDTSTRRSLTGNKSLLEAINEVLADKPPYSPGSPEFSAAVLVISQQACVEIYNSLAVPTAFLQGIPGKDSEHTAVADHSRKLLDSFKAIGEQVTILLKLEAELIKEPQMTPEKRLSNEKSLLENYAKLEEILEERAKLVTAVTASMPPGLGYTLPDQLDGMILGLERHLLSPRRGKLQESLQAGAK